MLDSADTDHPHEMDSVMVFLLASALSDLRDRLWDEGSEMAADLVADLVNRCDRFMDEVN